MRGNVSCGNVLIHATGLPSAKNTDVDVIVIRLLIKEGHTVKIVENIGLEVVIVPLAEQTMTIVHVPDFRVVLMQSFSEVIAISGVDDFT